MTSRVKMRGGRWGRRGAVAGAAGHVVEDLERRTLLAAAISGTLAEDLNGNGSFDAGEPALAGWTVYLDQNKNRRRDAGELSTVTNASGVYTFANLAAGTYYVAQEVPVGWQQTYPSIDAPGVNERPAGAARTAVPKVQTTGSKVAVHVQGEVDEGEPAPTDAQSNTLIRLTDFRADGRFSGINGAGFAVAVLDTGIDLNHPMFGPDADSNGIADRIVYQWDFADNDGDASDVNGHGSNVTSIAAGSDATHSGMAPGANIIALKVFRNNGTGQFSYIESALQWLVANAAAYNIAAVNMSLSDGQNWATPQQLYGIADEMAALAAQNVLVVSAAGNSFYEFQQPGAGYPATDPNSLGVGAVYDASLGSRSWTSGAYDATTGPDRITSFSQRSTTMTDIFAPGGEITGAYYNGSMIGYSGTSQASPHIAGLAVLAQQLAMQRIGRKLTLAEFRQLMLDTATMVYDGDNEDDNVANTNTDYGRVDALRLGDAIYKMSAGEYYPLGHKVVVASTNRTGLDFGARTIGHVAPGTPVLTVGSDTGRFNNDSVTKLDNSSAAKRLTFYVPNVIAGTTVTLYADGIRVGSVVANAQTAVITTSGTFDIPDGARVLTARQLAPGQPESAASGTRFVTIDSTPPPVPAAPDLDAGSDSGVSSSDNITTDATPRFNVFVGSGNFFQLYRDGGLISHAYSSGTAWFQSYTLPDSTSTYTVGALDTAGNESLSSPLTVTIDNNAAPIGSTLAPGALDSAFPPMLSAGPRDEGRSITVLPDGRFLVAGSTWNATSRDSDLVVARFLANGAIDTSFGVGGRATAKVRDRAHANTIAVQSDGKIVIGGMTAFVSGSSSQPRMVIVRFTAAGALDTTFASSGVFTASTYPMTNNGEVERVIIQGDGKILAAFTAGSNGNWADFGAVRLNTNGTLDTTFSGDGWATYDFNAFMDDCYSMELLPDGKVLLIGLSRTSGSSTYYLAMMRLTAAGALDTTFDGDGKLVTSVPLSGFEVQSALQPDGKIVLASAATPPGELYVRMKFMRFGADGVQDLTFGSGGATTLTGIGRTSYPRQVLLQSDGKIIAAGQVTDLHRGGESNLIVRLNADGKLDTLFGAGGVASAYVEPNVANYSEAFYGLVLLPDGKMLAAGTTSTYREGSWNRRLELARFHGGSVPLLPLDLQAASDLGISDSDNVTADNTPTFDLPDLGGGYARIYRDGLLLQGGFYSGSTWTAPTQPDGTATYQLRYVDAAGNETEGTSLSVTVDTAPASVSGVFVNGTTWIQTFRDFLAASNQGDAALGYRLDAASHADELPWINLNQLSVRFSEDVNVAARAMRVFGVKVAEYAGSFVYEPDTFTATWTLPTGAFAAEKLLVHLDDAMITDAGGNPLDGEWTNPPETNPVTAGGADTYPSGNGTPGGDFAMRLNVLPGDVTRDGEVVGNDVTSVRLNQGYLPGQSGYTIFRDVTGDGEIIGNDVTAVRFRQGIVLPAGTPVVPEPSPSMTMTATREDVRTTTSSKSKTSSKSPFSTALTARSGLSRLAQRFDLLAELDDHEDDLSTDVVHQPSL
ncbi:MAG TPA: S8 family serine peptidase [Tepidisphaeraceae bacterium]|nr:S8 family serine peptidase [Tepidisphaeraceae bacterium]